MRRFEKHKAGNGMEHLTDQKSEAGLDKVAMLSFCGAVLGTSVWT